MKVAGGNSKKYVIRGPHRIKKSMGKRGGGALALNC